MQVTYTKTISFIIDDYIVEAARSLKAANQMVAAVKLIRAHAKQRGYEDVGLAEAKKIVDFQI